MKTNCASLIAVCLSILFSIGIDQPLAAQQFEEVVSLTDINDEQGEIPDEYSGTMQSLLQVGDGEFLGTMPGGVFRLDKNGLITKLADSPGSEANLTINASNGYVYGYSTSDTTHHGKIFRMRKSGSAPEILATFNGTSGPILGSNPSCLFQAPNGTFLGITESGGINNLGTVFRISTSGQFETLLSFSGTSGNRIGSHPNNLLWGSDGNVYGTTKTGGSDDKGTIFRLDTATNFSFSILSEFGTGANRIAGQQPVSLVESNPGRFVGTTKYGGDLNGGTLYSFDTLGNRSIIHEFDGTLFLGTGSPIHKLVTSPAGEVFGLLDSDNGSVFRVGPDLQYGIHCEFPLARTLTGRSLDDNLEKFQIFHANGSIFGTLGRTRDSYGKSAIFYRISSPNTFEVISSAFFDADNDVYEFGIDAEIILADNQGRLIGSSFSYIIPVDPVPITLGRGRTFTISDNTVEWGAGGTQTPTTLARNPVAGIIFDREGRMLGSTKFGGTGAGTLFSATTSGSFSTFVNFNNYFFGDPDSGSRPVASLTATPDGSVFGMTTMTNPNSTHYVAPPTPDAFRLNPDLSFSWRRQLSIFNGEWENYPYYNLKSLNLWSSLTLSSDSFLYGRGFNNRILKISQSGDVTEFASSDVLLNGQGKLLEMGQGSNRRLLGTSSGVGSYTSQQPTPARIFSMTPEGAFTVLAQFDAGPSWTSGLGWQTGSFAAKSGSFVVAYDVRKDNYSGIDAVTGLASGPVDEFTDLACIVRMNTSGYFDVRNGAGYQADAQVSFSSYHTHRVVMTVNTTTHTYSVSVDGTPIATDYAFRTEQSAVNSLDRIALTAVSGSHWVGNVNLLSSSAGRLPLSGLIAGSDGWYYGTASQGGTYDKGTVYRMSGAGVLEKVADFNGANGAGPVCELLEHSDGWFYGVTPSGGAADLGTVFRVSSNGTIETLFDFANDPLDCKPYGTLCMGPDGAMYGTASGLSDAGGYGSVFRLVFAGAPAVYPLDAVSDGTNSALFHGKFNARGGSTSVRLELGSDGTTFPTIYNLSPSLTGYRTSELAKRLTGLTRGVTYYYRFRATSSAGETVGPVQTFDTTGPPVATALEATLLTGGSAQANGNVRAGNTPTSVAVEYGTDGVTFPHAVSATPALVNGSNEVPVKADLSGLENGATYHFRIKAENEFGLVYSPVMDFQTLSKPVTTVTGAFPVATASVRVEGNVDPRGLQAGVFFEFGTDGVNFPNSVAATPAVVVGNIATPVSAVLSNLQQGVLYRYRLKASSTGGDGLSPTIGTFELDSLSGFTRSVPTAPESAGGFVLVNIDPPLPAPLVAGWRFLGEKAWRPMGLPAAGLVFGSRQIEFRPLPGYNQPPRETVVLTPIAPFASLTKIYYEAASDGAATGGSLTVTLKPDSALPLARWRFLGQAAEADWRTSGATVTGLTAGSYLIECSDASALGLSAPQPGNVVVADGGSISVTLTYTATAASSGQAASLIPFETATSTASQNLPYAHIGQIRSDSGLASGFVVKPRVVATAAHVVFEDRFDTLGEPVYVTGLQWLFQQDAGGHEPIPRIPRGFYVLDGYAAARKKPGVVPGEGTQESQHYDVAALYFFGEDAGRGGYGGFLASDSADNEYLLSDDDKMLCGYPVDGIAAAFQGRLHATPPLNAHFSRTAGELSPSTPYRTYRTNSIRSSGGASGGPLCVRLDSGVWYPAAVYLGGSGESVVRAFDSTVVELFNRAEASSNDDNNHTGGGITHSGTRTLSGSDSGALKVNIQPAGAVTAGARWHLRPDPIYMSGGDRLGGINPGKYKLECLDVPGYQPPEIITIPITGGVEETYLATYVQDISKPSITSTGSALATRNKSFTYQITCSPAADSFTLAGDIPAGLSFNTSTGRITGTPQQTGVFSLTLGAVNAGGTGTRTLLLTSRPNVPNQSSTLTQGLAASYQIQSSETGNPATDYEADDLPAGLTLDPSSGLVTGSANQTGTHTTLVTVSRNGASASAILTLTVSSGGITLWRQQHFGTTSNTGSAADTADPDGDGNTNLTEYAAGTDPNNAADVFKILTAARSAGTFTVTAAGKAGRSYALERRANPTTGAWTTVASAGPLATDAPLTLTDTASPGSAAFYRIRVILP